MYSTNKLTTILKYTVVLAVLAAAVFFVNTPSVPTFHLSACTWVTTSCGSGCSDNKDIYNCSNNVVIQSVSVSNTNPDANSKTAVVAPPTVTQYTNNAQQSNDPNTQKAINYINSTPGQKVNANVVTTDKTGLGGKVQTSLGQTNTTAGIAGGSFGGTGNSTAGGIGSSCTSNSDCNGSGISLACVSCGGGRSVCANGAQVHLATGRDVPGAVVACSAPDPSHLIPQCNNAPLNSYDCSAAAGCGASEGKQCLSTGWSPICERADACGYVSGAVNTGRGVFVGCGGANNCLNEYRLNGVTTGYADNSSCGAKAGCFQQQATTPTTPTTPSTPSTPPSTPPAPVCLNLTVSKANPVLGDTVTFTCGKVNGVNHYEFQVKLPDGTTKALTATQNVSEQFTVTQPGAFSAQCRICTGAAETTCQAYRTQ